MIPLTSGQVAVGAGVNLQTVRFYERRGLLPMPARTPAGYRQFPPDTIARVRFIRRAQGLGFTLKEIQDLLALRVRRGSACASVRRQAGAKLAIVRQKQEELERLERAIVGLISACRRRRVTEGCPILDILDREAVAPVASHQADLGRRNAGSRPGRARTREAGR